MPDKTAFTRNTSHLPPIEKSTDRDPELSLMQMFLESFGVRLLCEKALLIEGEKRHLVVSDLHLGKAATFRAHGLPIPEGDSERDLNQLEQLYEKHKADSIIIAGDLFHAASGQTAEILSLFEKFRTNLPIPLTLITGNHDKKIRTFPKRIQQQSAMILGELRIIHDPKDSLDGFLNICGHIHPVLKIPDGRKTSLRLPCFHLRENVLTLPSFGTFTGGQIIRPEKNDRFFVEHQNSVIEVPRALLK